MIDKTLVILPGWGGSHKTWADFLNLAKSEFREVRVIDLPCFGDEPCPRQVWGVEEYADFVSKKLRSREARKVVLLGHSFGGAVATQLTATSPELIDKLILIGAAVFRPKNTLRRNIFGSIAKIGKVIFKLPLLNKFDQIAKKVLYRVADSPDYAKTAGIKSEIFRKIVRQDQSGLLPKIKTPCLVVWGSKDKMTPLKQGEKISSLLSDSRLVILQGRGHGLHLDDQTDLLVSITDFLRVKCLRSSISQSSFSGR